MTDPERSGTTQQPATAQHSRTVDIDGHPMHYVEYGAGPDAATSRRTVLALHGWMVDHEMMSGPLEPIFGERAWTRRIYLDLPGMGATPAGSIASSDDLLQAVLSFIDRVIGTARFSVIGLSYGGYLGRAITAALGEQVDGLALICPMTSVGAGAPLPEHVVLHREGDLSGILEPALEEQYEGYLVNQTPDTLRRFQTYEGSGFSAADQPSLDRIFARFQLTDEANSDAPYGNPTLIVTARQDQYVGYAGALDWLPQYPRATFAVLDRSGHGIPHEQPELLAALVREWLDRVDQHPPRSDEETSR